MIAALGDVPRVTVIIPAYNAEDTLGDTLASVLAQTFWDFEVIIVDDGSTDSTPVVAQSAEDKRVRLLSIPNGGVAQARNRGMHAANGTYVAFLDADDIWRPTKLERQVALLDARADVGMCFTTAIRVDGDNTPLAQMPALPYRDYCEALLLKSLIISGSCSSGVVRRELALDIGGFDPSLSQCADWDFWLRLSCVTTFAPVPDPLVLYRSYPGNMSSDVSLLERDSIAVLDKFFSTTASAPYREIRSRAYGSCWMICSGSYLHAGRIRSSLRCLIRGLASDPSSIRRPLGLPWRWTKRLVNGDHTSG